MEEKRKAAGLDTERVIPTYFHLALPVVVGSIITIVYNLADTYFIARTGNAALVAGVLCGNCDRRAQMKLAGGNLDLFWNADDNHVYQTGPAAFVFDGEWLEE